MTKQEFAELTEQGIVLMDGATGSNLRKAGMPVGVCTEQWVLEHPEIIVELQRAYAEAGSRIIYAPTFSANRISLAMHGLQDRLVELNTELARLTRKTVDEAETGGKRVYVAGDVTTTGKMPEPRGDVTYHELYEVYREQIKVLTDAGVDLIGAETLMSVEEAQIILDAAQSVCDLPVLCTLTLEADGNALFGGNAVELVETLQEMGASAAGLNCSVGPDQLESVVASMKAAARIPIVAKPNAGMPTMDEKGMAHYSMGPEQFAASMMRLVEAGAQIVGGCCGTNPGYMKELARRLSV